MENSQFNVWVTNAVKGVATLLLLLHHLFLSHPEYGAGLHLAAIEGKVCVSLFVLLSGYGLAASYRPQSVWHWYRSRFAKLYLNYWFIMLIFVPISWLVFGNTVYTVFPGCGERAWLKLISQIFGTQMYYGGWGFNPTWWFMSAILVLYALFPLFHRVAEASCVNKWMRYLVLMGIAAAWASRGPSPCFQPYVPAFVVGVLAARERWFSAFFSVGARRMTLLWVGVAAAAGVYIILWPQYSTLRYLLLSLIACVLVCRLYVRNVWVLTKPLEYLGRYSMTIFLTHSFIYYIFFRDFFYSLGNPWLMYGLLLSFSLLLAVALEFLMKLTRWNKLITLARG